MEIPRTVTDFVQLIAAISGSITLGGILLKLAFTWIEMKWKIENRDFITKTQLGEFCVKAQITCPKVMELSKFSGDIKVEVEKIMGSIKISAETLKEVVYEQKILRQITLPEKYVNYSLFKDTIERIERSLETAVTDMKGTAENIYNSLNDMRDRLPKP